MQSRDRNVRCDDARGAFERQRYSDCAGARTGVDDESAGRDLLESGCDEVLGLGPRDQNVRTDQKLAAVELLAFGDVLGRLAFEALMQVAAVMYPAGFREVLIGMGVEIRTIAMDGKAEEDFGGEARRCDTAFLKELSALKKRGLERRTG